jgi:hypothetical protein
LADVPLEFLQSYPSFGANRIWRIFQPKYYVCTDPLDAKKNLDVIRAMLCPVFLREGFGVGYPIDVILDNHHPQWNTFTPDPRYPVYDGCTVTYVALELAYWMGFTTVLLVGVDHRYTWDGPRLQTIVSDGSPDLNHFAPDYLRKGEKWQPPNLARMEAAYKIARAAYEADGRKIYNLTENTALDVFEKQEIALWQRQYITAKY